MTVASAPLHRTRDRRHLDIPIRVERLEEDADDTEFSMSGLHARLDTLNARVLGVLVSLLCILATLIGNLILWHH